MINIVIVYHSHYGHTRLQAEAVAKGAASVDRVNVTVLTAKDAVERIDELDRADAIVFGSPTYMGSMAAEMKKFLEAAVPKWFTQAWKNKIAGAFTNSSSFSGDKLNTLMGLFINAMQHGMIFVGLGLLPAANETESMRTPTGPSPNAVNRVGSFIGPMAASFQLNPGDGPPPGDLETARLYGIRVAEVTQQFVLGRKKTD
ncbi:flavodoxin family protein [bacterium]|nr:flavodoxin family protein [candidate division CSSED10-310 bacterium]